MIVETDKIFQKDVNEINDAKVKLQIFELIEYLEQVDVITSVTNIKKLAGYKDLYRIRMGNYRIGIIYINAETLRLVRFLHRKEIYKKWP